jgi:uncharacterized membrane protein YkvA (DUF1232 family)
METLADMTEQNWKPLYRIPMSTVTRVLRSPAFLHARERAAVTIESPSALRALADQVETLDHDEAPLSAVADRVASAVRFLRVTADRLEGEPLASAGGAGTAARERLLVAGLHYLVTPDDLVPDFRAGGYLDDVLLLTWVFGAALTELEPYLPEEPGLGPADGDDPVVTPEG